MLRYPVRIDGQHTARPGNLKGSALKIRLALNTRALALILTLTGLFGTPAWAVDSKPASPKFYTVELVIFQQTDSAVMQAEQWPTHSDISAPDRFVTLGAIESGATATMPTPYRNFTPLPAADMQLGDAVRLMEKSSRYHVLMHIGWRQPGLDASKALPIWIQQTLGGDGSPSDASAATPNTAADASSLSTPVSTPAPVVPNLQGTIRLHLSRYLHLSFDLDYTVPAPAGTTTDAAPTPAMPADIAADTSQPLPAVSSNISAKPQQPNQVVFILKEQRRVRSGELNYFDHPAFGVLALVTPYTPPVSKPAAATPGQGTVQR